MLTHTMDFRWKLSKTYWKTLISELKNNVIIIDTNWILGIGHFIFTRDLTEYITGSSTQKYR